MAPIVVLGDCFPNHPHRSLTKLRSVTPLSLAASLSHGLHPPKKWSLHRTQGGSPRLFSSLLSSFRGLAARSSGHLVHRARLNYYTNYYTVIYFGYRSFESLAVLVWRGRDA